MFKSMESILLLDDEAVQLLLRKLDMETLATALKGEDDDIKDRFIKNMSVNAAECLENIIKSDNYSKALDIDLAQKNMLSLLSNLKKDKKI